jgi:tRNA(Ile)-lysidine synthase
MLACIRRHDLLRPGDRVGVAVSGGADSVALLRLLLEARSELGILLAVVHFNHRIRAVEADADGAFVAELARRHGLEFHCGSGETVAHARESRLSLEAAARELRYTYFHRLLGTGILNRIATAHTLDDQSETVMLRFLRGAGTRGIAGIYPKIAIPGTAAAGESSESYPDPARSHVAKVSIVRPLLGSRRQQLRDYLASLGQPWREDATNLDLKHSRNRVRHKLIPLLESDYNPAVQRILGESAEVARDEEDFWQEETARMLPKILTDSRPGATAKLRIGPLQQQPLALRRRLIRAAAEKVGARLDFHHVEQALALAETSGGAIRRSELCGGFAAVCGRGELWFEHTRQSAVPICYEYELPVPGVVEIRSAGVAIRAFVIDSEAYNIQNSLDPALLGLGLRVRNWRAGDRYRPAHSKSAKKLKELLQERHIPRTQKAMWPVVLAGDKMVWVPGWDFPEEFWLRRNGPGIVLTQEQLPSQKLL